MMTVLAGVLCLVAAAVIHRLQKQLRKAEADNRALTSERDRMYDVLQAQVRVIQGWKAASLHWRCAAVQLLHKLNPEGAVVVKDAIATAETKALVQRVEAAAKADARPRG